VRGYCREDSRVIAVDHISQFNRSKTTKLTYSR
jgi:hypothetical protein